MAKKAQYPPPTRYSRCPFCGGTPLTKTHIWPKWLKTIIPETGRFYSVSHEPTTWFQNLEERKRSEKFDKRDLFSQQPYLTCYGCNGGWMKFIEDEVVKFVKPIILGTYRGRINYEQQKTFSGWLALIATLSEMASYAHKTVRPDDLQFLRKYGYPPSSWTIFVASSNTTRWRKRRDYNNLFIFETGGIPEIRLDANGLPLNNTQIVTLGIGNLLVQVFICPNDYLVQKYRNFNLSTGLKMLWPINLNRRMKFPPTVKYDDSQANDLAWRFYKTWKQFIPENSDWVGIYQQEEYCTTSDCRFVASLFANCIVARTIGGLRASR